ncbi:hypothetical protein FB451DRAFT_1400909 [Mycena latifolia]|nr:hypothetical protein FB451DRAFT_1400909 [Mycena latifolia]
MASTQILLLLLLLNLHLLNLLLLEDDGNEEWVDEPDPGIPAGQPGMSTWHQQNPDRPVIPLRAGRKKETAETRATTAMKCAAKAKNNQDLQANIDAINEARNKMAEEIAEKHSVKVDLVLWHLMAKNSFKVLRKVNLFNAKPISWEESKRRVLEEEEFQLVADRAVAKSGSRATNAAAAADACFTVAMISEEMTALAEHTGMVGFAMFTHGHVQDTSVPTEVESWGSLQFFHDVLHLEPRDLSAQYELWGVACEKVDKTSKKNISINRVQYRKVMVLKHSVILRGWPLKGDPVNPNNIHDLDSMVKVCDTMKSGKCFWHKLTDREKEMQRLEYEELVEDGTIEVKMCKVCADKDKKRKKSGDAQPLATCSKDKNAQKCQVWDEDSNEEEDRGGKEQPKKKQRREEKENGRERRKEKECEQPKKCKACNDDNGGDSNPPSLTSASRSSSSKTAGSSKKSSSSSTHPPSRFQLMHKKLQQLANGKKGNNLSKLPLAMRRPGPPGIRSTDQGFDDFQDSEENEE